MGRAIVGVVLGYAVMFAVVFTTFTAAFLGMGADRAFQPGTYDVSGLWIGVSIVLGLATAILGGLVLAVVSRCSKAPLALAVLVVVLGLALAVPVLTAADDSSPPARTGEVGNFEAMTKAKQPPWIALLNPLVGAVGVLVGARLVRPAVCPT